jgi:hypothetical protein
MSAMQVGWMEKGKSEEGCCQLWASVVRLRRSRLGVMLGPPRRCAWPMPEGQT